MPPTAVPHQEDVAMTGVTYPVTPADVSTSKTPVAAANGPEASPDPSPASRKVVTQKPKESDADIPALQAGSQDDAPFAELPNDGPDAFTRAREAVAAIRGRGRGPDGRVLPGNTAAMTHGLASAQLLDHPDIKAWHAEQMAAITADLGGDAEMSALVQAHVREAARVEVILAALGEDLMTRGPLTAKGKMRAASTLYLQVLDRFMRLSAALGLERRQKPVPSIHDVLRGDAS